MSKQYNVWIEIEEQDDTGDGRDVSGLLPDRMITFDTLPEAKAFVIATLKMCDSPSLATSDCREDDEPDPCPCEVCVEQRGEGTGSCRTD